MQLKSININDDVSLEKEADRMGARAMQFRSDANYESLLTPGIDTTIHQFIRSDVLQRVDKLSEEFRPDSFKRNTAVKGSQRGESLQAIDSWLKAYWKARDQQDQATRNHCLIELARAISHWQSKHNRLVDTRNKSSVEKRRPVIESLQSELNDLVPWQDAGLGGDTSSTELEDIETTGSDLLDGPSEIIAAMGGVTGDYADRNLIWKPENATDDSRWGKEGGAQVNNPDWDIAEGSNLISGIIGVARGFSKARNQEMDKWEIAENLGETEAAAMQGIHGTYKLAKGIKLKQIGDSQTASDKATATSMTQVGDIGASAAEGMAAIAGFISFLKKIRDIKESSDETGQLTTRERLENFGDLLLSGTKTAHSGLKTGLNITKAASEGGAKTAISGMATASGVLSMITGSIEFLHGGIQLIHGAFRKSQISKAEAYFRKAVFFSTQKIEELEIAFGVINWEVTTLGELRSLMTELEKFQNTLSEINRYRAQYEPALQKVNLLLNKRLEDAAFKTAGGAASIVSGALLVSGVGAPIAVAIGAISALVAIGKISLNWRRNAAAGRLGELARRLSPDGQPQGRPQRIDGWSEAEKRVKACYYSHLKQVIEKEKPPGLKKDQFMDVKRYVWDDKKRRIQSMDKTIIKNLDEIGALSREQKENTWIQYNQTGGLPPLKEKPKGWDKFNLKTSADAAMSETALSATKKEVAEAVYSLGTLSYRAPQNEGDEPKFIKSPIVPVGPVEESTIQEMQKLTSTALLDAVGITAKNWKKWLEKAGPNEEKMKEIIIEKLPG
jgi:hypothetical protein